ncbi:MAG: PA2928 family protein [Microbacterium sp.]
MKRIGIGVVLLLVAAFVAVFFIVPGPMISTAARVGQGLLFAQIDGRDAVIIAYDDNGFSGVGFLSPWHHDGRIAAFDLDTGETIWEHGLDGEGASLTRMIAAGEKYAYLETTFGLRVIALADGSTVATEADIPGLGEFDGLTTTFAFSRSEGAIMVNPEEGVVRKIVLDTLEAVDVDARTYETWECVLAWTGHGYAESDDEAVTVDRMPADREVLGFGVPSGSPPGTPGKRLTRLNDDGSGVSLGAETFVSPGFVAQSVLVEPIPLGCGDAQWDDDVFPDGKAVAEPLGTRGGYAVVDHARNARTDDRQITVVDAVSGEVLGSNPAEGGLVDAATAPSGQAVVIVDRFLPGVLPSWGTTPVTSTLLFIAADGSMREIVLAPHGWLGLPW